MTINQCDVNKLNVLKAHKWDENGSNTMKIHQSNVNSMIWWKCIYKMRIHDSDKKSTNFMEIQLCDKTDDFDKHLSLRWKFISLMRMYQSDEIYYIDNLRSPCWPIKFFYWVVGTNQELRPTQFWLIWQ